MGRGAVQEAEATENHIGLAVRAVRLAACRDDERLLTHEVEDHRDVMSAQVPERARLASSPSQILPNSLHVVEIAEVAELDQLLQLANRGMEEQQMLDHEPASLAAGQLDQQLGMPARLRQGLRHEDVLRSFERPARQFEVRVSRRCDRDRVDRLVCEQIVEPP